MHIAVRVVAASRHGEDRAAAIPCESGQLLLVADGAGGRAGGAAAAEAVLRSVQCLTSAPSDWAAWLEDLDLPLQDLAPQLRRVVF